MSSRQHAPGEGSGFEPLLQQHPRRDVRALAGTADDEDIPIAGELAETRPELSDRDVERFRHILHSEFHGLAHIEEESLLAESQ